MPSPDVEAVRAARFLLDSLVQRLVETDQERVITRLQITWNGPGHDVELTAQTDPPWPVESISKSAKGDDE